MALTVAIYGHIMIKFHHFCLSWRKSSDKIRLRHTQKQRSISQTELRQPQFRRRERPRPPTRVPAKFRCRAAAVRDEIDGDPVLARSDGQIGEARQDRERTEIDHVLSVGEVRDDVPSRPTSQGQSPRLNIPRSPGATQPPSVIESGGAS